MHIGFQRSMIENKHTIRTQVLKERNALNAAVRSEWSHSMRMVLEQSFEYAQASTVHIFLSSGSEPETDDIIRSAWSQAKQVVVPLSNTSTTQLHHARYKEGMRLEAGPYGIRQPVDIEPVSEDEMHAESVLIVTPVVAFNSSLYRIGYGKGYYDRFLANRRGFAFGLAYSLCFRDNFQPESHDVALDAMVTEQGMVRRRSSQLVY